MFQDLAWTLTLLVGLAAISWLVATFMPNQMQQVGDTVAESGPVSFGVGLLTVILSVAVGIPLLITICLAFIPILVYILIGIATLFGWIRPVGGTGTHGIGRGHVLRKRRLERMICR